MSNKQSQGRVRERKRDLLKRPFRQALQWIATHWDEFGTRSSPPQQELQPANPAPSPRNGALVLDVPVPPSVLEPPAEMTLLLNTSVSPVPLEPVTQGDPVPLSPAIFPHQERDRFVGNPHADDILQRPILVPPNESAISSDHPGQEICPPNPSQVLEVAAFPLKHDIQNDDPLPLPGSSAHDILLESLSSDSPPLLPPPGESFDNKPLHAIRSYGSVYNIETAGNVFSGINYGSVTMIVDDFFATSYLERLKVTIRANHMYHPCGEESALRRVQCTPGTRVSIIRGVASWATNPSLCSELVYWLSGQAGAGKTTIAYTIACLFENLIGSGNNKAILGGSFFCSRQFPDTRSVSAIIRTIVYQLALKSKPFQAALKEHGRLEVVNHGPKSQLMGLLIEPWKMSAAGRLANDEPCYILPIDALDELDGESGSEFLSILFDVLEQEDLSGLRFFITSRPHPALVNRIASFSNKRVCRLEEVPLNESSADIRVYLDTNLSQCATPQQVQQLVSDAAGLFIYASTVVEYVMGRALEEQRNLLKHLLSTSPSSFHRRPRNATASLDSLYLQILETSLVDPRDHGDPDVFQECLSILHTFLCTIERTSVTVAVAILQESSEQSDINTGTAEGVLLRLHAVLYTQDSQVMSFHRSFSDFLFDQGRSKEFYCNREQLHHRLADACFRMMARQLRFNISDIRSSYQMDGDNRSLRASIDTNISAPLRYVCRNWSAHVILTPVETLDGFADLLHEFLQLRVLFWMESMNLLGQRGRCQGMLRDAQRWFAKSKVGLDYMVTRPMLTLSLKGPTELIGRLADAAAFAAYHSASGAALSTPHLYLSSLATFSRRTTMVQNWRRQFGGIPDFTSAFGIGGEALVACITVRSKVGAVAVSPDSVNIAVGLDDGLVEILDMSTGEQVRALRGHTDCVAVVAYSPDGRQVVSGSADRSLRVWDASTGEEVRALRAHTDCVTAVAYSPDGSRVVSGSSDRSIRVWDVSTGVEVRVLEGHAHGVFAVAYSPDGMHVVSGSFDKSLRVWDISTGEEVRVLGGHTHCVYAVAYFPDGTHVVSGSSDRSIRVWDVSRGEEERVLNGHPGAVYAVAFSPDERHVVSGSLDKSLRVWDVFTGVEVRVFNGHTERVSAVAYSPDGTHVVSGSFDKSLRVWDVLTGVEVRDLEGHTERVSAVAYSPDGTHVVSGSYDRSLRVLDMSMEQEVRVLVGHTHWVSALAYSPDGNHVVSGSFDKSIRVWDVYTGENVRVLEGHTDYIRGVAYSPDGTHVVSGSDDKSLRVWDACTGEELRVLKGHTRSVNAVAYSPDGSHVVSGSDDKAIWVWDACTGEELRVLMGHTNHVRTVAYSPEGGHVLSGSSDKSIRLWDASTGENIRVLEGHTDCINAVAYSPNGAHVVSGSDDKSIRVWDVPTGREMMVLSGHTNRVYAVAYSPDGAHAVSGSSDMSVRVWDVSPKHTPRYMREQGLNGEYTGRLVSPTDPKVCLMFVRPEALLPHDYNIRTFPASVVSHLDLSNSKLGDRWVECYTPRAF